MYELVPILVVFHVVRELGAEALEKDIAAW